jgi:hypothetical protein
MPPVHGITYDSMRRAIMLPILLSLAPACRYSSVAGTGSRNPAPYVGLDCFDEDNPEGFSFEVPACYCSGGIRFRYVVHRNGAGVDVSYEQERGFLTDRVDDDVRILARTPSTVDRLFVAGRELPPRSECDAAGKEAWDRNEEIFRGFFESYAHVLGSMQRTCAMDRIEKAVY